MPFALEISGVDCGACNESLAPAACPDGFVEESGATACYDRFVLRAFFEFQLEAKRKKDWRQISDFKRSRAENKEQNGVKSRNDATIEELVLPTDSEENICSSDVACCQSIPNASLLE